MDRPYPNTQKRYDNCMYKSFVFIRGILTLLMDVNLKYPRYKPTMYWNGKELFQGFKKYNICCGTCVGWFRLDFNLWWGCGLCKNFGLS